MTEENTNGSITRGVHHIGLTVPDLEQTRAFFLETLGYDQVGEVPDYPAVFVSDGSIMITLWQASDPASAVPFDRKNGIGLHHLAVTVDADAIDGLCNKLNGTAGVEVEFEPEPLG
ncbi:MAG: VOC family protein, partial [Lysobacterales bacterium]